MDIKAQTEQARIGCKEKMSGMPCRKRIWQCYRKVIIVEERCQFFQYLLEKYKQLSITSLTCNHTWILKMKKIIECSRNMQLQWNHRDRIHICQIGIKKRKGVSWLWDVSVVKTEMLIIVGRYQMIK